MEPSKPIERNDNALRESFEKSNKTNKKKKQNKTAARRKGKGAHQY